MTLTLELSPELEAHLQKLSAEKGQDPATYVASLISNTLPLSINMEDAKVFQEIDESRLTFEEFEAAMDKLADENPDLVVLAPEATSRAAMYGEYD